MNTAELMSHSESSSSFTFGLNGLRKRIAQVRLVVRFLSSLVQKKDDEKMLEKFMEAQEKAHDLEIFKRAHLSLPEVEDDIEAIGNFLAPLYQIYIPKRYDVLIFQALEEEITWFLYPLFLQALRQNPGNPDKIIQIFRDSTQTLNLLGKNVSYNQAHEDDSQIFLSGDRIEASEGLKKAAIGKVHGCPLMRVKTALHGTLMTDFMITCVKFWTYRKVLQAKNTTPR